MKKTEYFLLGGILVFVFAFLLNFLWESVHAVLFYEGHDIYTAIFFVRMILYASTIDASLILGIFLTGCLLWKTNCWLEDYGSKKLFFTASLGFLIALFIEAKALFLEQWKYNELMPTIAGIGLSPLLQLSITGVISFMVVSKLLYTR